MNKLGLALCLAILGLAPAQAQSVVPPLDTINCAFNTSPPTVSTGSMVRVQCDNTGKLLVSGTLTTTPSSSSSAALAPSSTAALAANQTVKGSAGNLYSFEISADSTLSGAAWWIMIYDATAAPSDGSVTPKKCYAMASGVTSYAAAWVVPVTFATGIVIGVSTTGCFTKTASTHAFISGDAQ